MKRNWTYWLVSGVILLLSFVVCRYGLFDLHGMKSWPKHLFLMGGLFFLIAMGMRSRYIPLFTAVGYPLAFAVGLLFRHGGPTPHGGTIDRLWLVWTVTYLCIIAAGGVVELIARKRGR